MDPRDGIILSLEEHILANLRVIESASMACQEAALTGESVLIDKSTGITDVSAGENHDHIPLKDRKKMCTSATLVTQDSGQFIIVAIDDFTQLGTINRFVSQTEKKKINVLGQIDQISKILAVMILPPIRETFIVAKFARD